MNLLSYLFPHKYTYHSEINGEIQVIEFMGKITLYCGGVTQSGGFTDKMWENSLSKIKKMNFSPKNCLVLGTGGGTVIELIAKKFPGTLIKAIDIDPVMVKIAQKHFHVGTSPGTSVEINDAIEFIAENKDKESFDLIVVDLYIGRLNPRESHEEEFIKNLREILKEGGFILYNSHFRSDNTEEYGSFLSFSRKIFSKVEEIDKYPLSRLLLIS